MVGSEHALAGCCGGGEVSGRRAGESNAYDIVSVPGPVEDLKGGTGDGPGPSRMDCCSTSITLDLLTSRNRGEITVR